MFGIGCECFCWDSASEFYPFLCLLPFQWTQGQGFATGKICLREIVLKITKFDSIWSCIPRKSKGVAFYRPVDIPEGFFSFGHYCQPNDQPLSGYVLVARDVGATRQNISSVCGSVPNSPALKKPVGYTLIWLTDSHHSGCGLVWLPKLPAGYKAMGYVVTASQMLNKLDV